jgi:hypothetical protein
MDKSIEKILFANHSPRFKPWAMGNISDTKTVLTA